MKIEIYLDTGVVYSYEAGSIAKAREHASEIIRTGFRCTPKESDDLEWFPPHRIRKIKIVGGGKDTQYKTECRVT